MFVSFAACFGFVLPCLGFRAKQSTYPWVPSWTTVVAILTLCVVSCLFVCVCQCLCDPMHALFHIHNLTVSSVIYCSTVWLFYGFQRGCCNVVKRLKWILNLNNSSWLSSVLAGTCGQLAETWTQTGSPVRLVFLICIAMYAETEWHFEPFQPLVTLSAGRRPPGWSLLSGPHQNVFFLLFFSWQRLLLLHRDVRRSGGWTACCHELAHVSVSQRHHLLWYENLCGTDVGHACPYSVPYGRNIIGHRLVWVER